MTNRIKIQLSPIAMLITVCCMCLIPSSIAMAGAIGIQYNSQNHHANNGHHHTNNKHQLRGAAGNVQYRNDSQHNFSTRSHYRHHNKHHYSYPRYRNCSSPAKRYYSQPYSRPVFDSRFPNSYRNYDYGHTSPVRIYRGHNSYSHDAWEILAQGQVRLALNQFSADIKSYPKSGSAKIGYSLSSALSGKMNQSVYEMRRAFKFDFASLYQFQLGHHLYPMVYEIRDKYQSKLKSRSRQKDAAFMVASLNYLTGDYSSAHHALERAKRDGDRSHSFRVLKNFISETQLSAGNHSSRK